MTNRSWDILGVGAPIIDLILSVSEEFIKSISGVKGGSEEITYSQIQEYILQSGRSPVHAMGGSAANTLKGLARMGQKCAMTGKVGTDEIGREFIKHLDALKIVSLLSKSSQPTTEVLAMITPDRERTMRYFAGASLDMRPDDLFPIMFENVKLVHIEGYTLLNPSLTERTMHLAHAAGARISFDCASFEIVQKNKELLQRLIPKYVTILFANEDEAKVLTGLAPDQGCKTLSKLCTTAVVLNGKNGSWIGHQNSVQHVAAIPVEVVDTTGAGDLYASGFLYGYLNNADLSECGYFGSLIASTVVQIMGTDIPENMWKVIQKDLKKERT